MDGLVVRSSDSPHPVHSAKERYTTGARFLMTASAILGIMAGESPKAAVNMPQYFMKSRRDTPLRANSFSKVSTFAINYLLDSY